MDVSSKTVLLINIGAALALIGLLSIRFAGFSDLPGNETQKAAGRGCFYPLKTPPLRTDRRL
jgi:hypothetical protein